MSTLECISLQSNICIRLRQRFTLALSPCQVIYIVNMQNMLLTGNLDGAARALELLGTEEMKNKFYERLVRYERKTLRSESELIGYRFCSRDPNQNWTSGQWMTERPGGSDVGKLKCTQMHELYLKSHANTVL